MTRPPRQRQQAGRSAPVGEHGEAKPRSAVQTMWIVGAVWGGGLWSGVNSRACWAWRVFTIVVVVVVFTMSRCELLPAFLFPYPSVGVAWRSQASAAAGRLARSLWLEAHVSATAHHARRPSLQRACIAVVDRAKSELDAGRLSSCDLRWLPMGCPMPLPLGVVAAWRTKLAAPLPFHGP